MGRRAFSRFMDGLRSAPKFYDNLANLLQSKNGKSKGARVALIVNEQLRISEKTSCVRDNFVSFGLRRHVVAHGSGGVCTKKAPAKNRGLYGSGRIGSAVRMVFSPVIQGSYALRCRDCTGPKPLRLFSPYLAGFARRPCHPALMGCFRVSQKFGQSNLLRLTASKMASAGGTIKGEIPEARTPLPWPGKAHRAASARKAGIRPMRRPMAKPRRPAARLTLCS